MVGIFRRFFGSRGKADSIPAAEPISKPKKSRDNAFFLDPDEAKTFGNIDYMRTPKTVKHTFLDFGATEKVEVVEQISSLGKAKLITEEPKTAEAASEEGSDPTISTSSQVNPRRQAGSDMDTFRNMARNLRRK
ncbi:MAG: hypothetical protein Q6L68_02275 [Thermostichus sp. DG02_5_bins_236]